MLVIEVLLHRKINNKKTMKKIFLAIAVSALFFSCSNSGTKVSEQGDSENVPECCRNKAGEILFPSEVSSKGDLYLEKEIKVRGYVKKVCHCSGKKCQVADNDEAEVSLMVFAGEEIGKFDQELVGKMVQYTGVVKENRITKEMIAESEAKMAEQTESVDQKPEKKSCCSTDTSEKSKSEEQGHCRKKGPSIQEMKEWMQANEKDYYPTYSFVAKSYEVIE